VQTHVAIITGTVVVGPIVIDRVDSLIEELLARQSRTRFNLIEHAVIRRPHGQNSVRLVVTYGPAAGAWPVDVRSNVNDALKNVGTDARILAEGLTRTVITERVKK